MAEIGGELGRAGRFSSPAQLTVEHDLTRFACGSDQLDDWLRNRALKNENRFSRTYVLCEGHRVVAFYCLAAGSVERAIVPSKLRRNAPDAVPVAIIGRLAVDRECAGQGLGTEMLADALRRIAIASRSVGIAAALVHAKDEPARRFYLGRAEFIEFPPDSRILYLPIETVIAALT